MFLDALCEDAAWQARYAKDRKGNVIPWDLIERNIREKHPYKVMAFPMIAVPYFEKALYELPEDQLTKENILRIADEIEERSRAVSPADSGMSPCSWRMNRRRTTTATCSRKWPCTKRANTSSTLGVHH